MRSSPVSSAPVRHNRVERPVPISNTRVQDPEVHRPYYVIRKKTQNEENEPYNKTLSRDNDGDNIKQGKIITHHKMTFFYDVK